MIVSLISYVLSIGYKLDGIIFHLGSLAQMTLPFLVLFHQQHLGYLQMLVLNSFPKQLLLIHHGCK